jgi:hypothetical protein
VTALWIAVQSTLSGVKKFISAGGVAQVVEHLPSKCENLSSNPNNARRRHSSTTVSAPRTEFYFITSKRILFLLQNI